MAPGLPNVLRWKEFLENPSPARLLVLFNALAALSVLAILAAVGAGTYQVYRAEMVGDAEAAAVAVGKLILEQERQVLLRTGEDGATRVAPSRSDFAGLNARMKVYLPAFDIFKIKVYSADRTIVYSTDAAIVGRVDSDNAKLAEVLAKGAVNSSLGHKDSVWDLDGEQRLTVDVVETYLPIRVGERIVGAFELYVDTTRTRERIMTVLWRNLGVLLAVLVAAFASLNLVMRRGVRRLAQVQQELEDLATVDSLTGMLNRRSILGRAQECHAKARRGGRPDTPLSVGFALADVDHFKPINDTHGHAVGDAVLRHVAMRMRSVLRGYDVVGRYGGEEFLAVLQNVDAEGARQVAERMREAVGVRPVPVAQGELPVTISVGVAVCDCKRELLDSAIKRADDAMYEAKRAGRNRVVVSPAFAQVA